ncbi:hypothetical protein KIH86_20325 [Paenibacillus sp. HN-1]|uniref:hypothetical protein n=1 Tax=Paenibacillus TaxID=44249 RepID=UPI001CA9F6E9|nr:MULTISPECIES: hypothetical protein [Paenibacillus]MBY9077074.1 hypothetical protein [Paenibacillus sp. CGMCC 1.18879]MBY9086553.1 hypothetical protein [Paenibacillus sinensis]
MEGTVVELEIRDLIDIRRPDESIEAAVLIEAPDSEPFRISRKGGISAGDEAPGPVSEKISMESDRDTLSPAHPAYSGLGQEGVPAVISPLFWSFPVGRGARQPWRTRLWEHRSSQS